MDTSFNLPELLDCPDCRGPALLEEEEGWCVYVSCLDCGCHTAEIPFRTEEERQDAIRRVTSTWNMGKVIRLSPGE